MKPASDGMMKCCNSVGVLPELGFGAIDGDVFARWKCPICCALAIQLVGTFDPALASISQGATGAQGRRNQREARPCTSVSNAE